MNTRLFLYAFLISTIFACGSEEKKTTTTSTANETTQETKNVEVPKTITLEAKIAKIKHDFSSIEKQLSSLNKKAIMENGGGGFTELECYFNEKMPKKIKVSEMGEHGSMITTYYFKENNLFFVFEQEFSETTMRGPFTNTEKRFYIYDNQLIRVLEKEKTYKSGTVDMSKVENVDKTETWKSKPNTVSSHIRKAQETFVKFMGTETFGLPDGRWMSTDDANSGIEIKNARFYMFTKVDDKIVSTAYDYELDEKDGIEYLTLKDSNGGMTIYGLLEYSEETMVLSYLDRGSTLTYTKEK